MPTSAGVSGTAQGAGLFWQGAEYIAVALHALTCDAGQ